MQLFVSERKQIALIADANLIFASQLRDRSLRNEEYMNKRQLGSKWEELAVSYLEQNGYELIQTNYRCSGGEIDIIASEQNTLCFIEVKYRSGNICGSSLEAVTPAKQRKIRKAALHYLTMVLKTENTDCRFDVVGFDRDTLFLIKNAF